MVQDEARGGNSVSTPSIPERSGAFGPMSDDSLVREALQKGLLEPDDLRYVAEMTPERFRRLYTVAARRTRHVTVVLEAVDDGHNQAAVLRSADAFGVQDVHVLVGKAPFRPSEGVARGSERWLTIHRHPSPEAAFSALRAAGYVIAASALDPTAVPLEALDFARPTAFVFGNEKDGLSEAARALADVRFIVPMVGFVESLNVSVAAAITLYTATQKARALVGERFFLGRDERRALLGRWLRQANDRTRRLAALEKESAEAGGDGGKAG